MSIRFVAMPTREAKELRGGGADAYGSPPERGTSDGGGNPCRHCLRDIGEGEKMLTLAYRPFAGLQPYAETGPIFLCGAPCERHPEMGDLPEICQSRPRILIRAYGAEGRIRYGTGMIVETRRIVIEAERLLDDPAAAYIHLRSAGYNCFQCRIERS